MNRFLTVLLFLATSVIVSAAPQGDVKGEVVAFDKKIHNFGDVPRENRNYSCSFVVENRSDEPLVLLSVNTSCSCLKAHYSRRPIKVGESATISMELEAEKMEPGVFRRVVEVVTNAGKYLITVQGNSVAVE